MRQRSAQFVAFVDSSGGNDLVSGQLNIEKHENIYFIN